ncbi:hypothetical protein V6N11_079674 [Hibiscus sabdariffa]|uniref:Uncharacterized protein n=2 Tax=Hibiscus sabdariffa TaxID=183260 RepID=A0ABR2RWC6_9ROSI
MSPNGVVVFTNDATPPMNPLTNPPSVSYIDSLMGENKSDNSDEDGIFDDDEIEFMDGDVTRSMTNGLISIDFSERSQLNNVEQYIRAHMVEFNAPCTASQLNNVEQYIRATLVDRTCLEDM